MTTLHPEDLHVVSTPNELTRIGSQQLVMTYELRREP